MLAESSFIIFGLPLTLQLIREQFYISVTVVGAQSYLLSELILDRPRAACVGSIVASLSM